MFCSKCGAPNPEGASFCQQCSAPLPAAVAQAMPAPAAPWLPETFAYAGFWRRFFASLVDGLILGAVGGVLGFVAAIPLGLLGVSSSSSYSAQSDVSALQSCATLVLYVVGAAIGWLYYACFESSASQATPGKMALGIVVTDMAGNRISFGRASGRFFGKIVSAMILYIGFLMAGFTEKKQALHDMMAGCLVMRK